MTPKDVRAMRELLDCVQGYPRRNTFDVLLSANDRRLLIFAMEKVLAGREK